MLHPEIKKFWEDAGYTVEYQFEEIADEVCWYATKGNWIPNENRNMIKFTIAHTFKGFPSRYYLKGFLDLSEEEMLRMIRLMEYL